MTLRLRPYQREALTALDGALDTDGEGLLVAATGTGKTTIFSKLTERRVALGERALILAHRTELIEQARHRLVQDTGLDLMDVGVEQATQHASPANRVVVASVQTLHKRRLAKFRPDEFDLVIVDEAHHARAKSYERILAYFTGAKRLGVTATPDRLDGKGLAKAFGQVAYAYEIRDAIDDGYLVPIKARMVYVDSIDLSDVRTTAGDLNEGDLDKVLDTEQNLLSVVAPSLEICGDRPTLVFANTVAHAHNLAKVFNLRRPGCARAVDGTTDKGVRRQTLREFKARKFQYLINCALFTEGVDLPLTAAIVMARPTKSRAFYTQMVGRGTRCLGRDYEESCANGKRDLLVVDFVGNAGRHKLVCALDILDSSVDETVRQRAYKKAKEGDEYDIDDLLEVAAEEQLELDREALQAKVKYRVVTAQDQFTILGVRPRPGRWGGQKPSHKQRAILKQAKVKNADNLDKGQASAVIGKIFERRKKGLCTLPMASQLAARGIDPDLPMHTAKRVLDEMTRYGWAKANEQAAKILEREPGLAAKAS